ncbi:MAG: chemotaxis protein CheX [Spirochaetaceae bacterium]|jgi:chemotaxis protein CheX|nr:chemotaxis protein CheX [Spirochaetaceae bacterium]
MERYIKPFVDVSIGVFKEFVGYTIVPGRAFFIDKNTPRDWDVSGIIGLTGEARGAVVISMQTELALKLTGILTGQEHRVLDDETVDAIGEIVNIIAGNAKRELEESFRLVISLPTIVKGKNHTIQWPVSQVRIICIPFMLEDHTFYLSVAIESVKEYGPPAETPDEP